MTTAHQRYTWLVEALIASPGVSGPDPSSSGFGSAALKVNGTIFAMLNAERLVVKLPQAGVEALIGGGTGEPFTAGKTRPMSSAASSAQARSPRGRSHVAIRSVPSAGIGGPNPRGAGRC